nr:hypothetical protein CFP56_34176 [Quercus suber]
MCLIQSCSNHHQNEQSLMSHPSLFHGRGVTCTARNRLLWTRFLRIVPSPPRVAIMGPNWDLFPSYPVTPSALF